MSRTKIVKNISFDDVRKVYYVTFNYGMNDKGKNIKTTKTFSALSKAKTALKMFEANKTRQEIVSPNNDTLENYLEYWIRDVKGISCEETTLYGYQLMMNKHIIPKLGKYKIQDISTMILNKYFSQQVKDGLSNNTVRKHYTLLKDALKQAKIDGKIYQNPLESIVPIKITQHEQNCYTIELLQNLFDAVRGQKIEIAIRLAGSLGLRREEIAGLKWEYINFENHTLSISEARTSAGKRIVTKDTKNDPSHRILFMPDDIEALLKGIQIYQIYCMKGLGKTEDDYVYVMCKNDGTTYRPNYISNCFKETLEKYNLPHIRFHDLRHTFASIANDLGVSLFDISKALGHGEIATTSKVYTHMFDKTNKKAIDIVSKQLNKS